MNDERYFLRLSIKKEENLFKAASLLNKWLDDLLLSGIAVLRDDPEKILEISTRMVDLGMPGIARRLRLIPEKIRGSNHWTEHVLVQIGELYLFTKTFQNLDKMDALEREDLLNVSGVVFSKSDFPDNEVFQDEWLYLGNMKEKEEKFIVKRNWFYGIHSNHIILLLEFQFNKFIKFKPFKCGTTYRSAVKYFPSKIYQRVKDVSLEQIVKAEFQSIKKINLNQLLDQYCDAIFQNPFIKHQCYILTDLKIANHSGKWFFTHDENQLVVISNEASDIPTILNYSTEKDACYVCEYYNNSIQVISIQLNNIMVEI